MKLVKKLNNQDILVLKSDFFKDERGYFYEAFNLKKFQNLIGAEINFVQDNHSLSKKNVLRGLHFQTTPFAQGKLIRVLKGEIFDVVLDLRENSPNFGKYDSIILSSENNYQLWIPEGFAHGFYAMSDNVEILYKTTKFYMAEYEKTILYNDEDLNIKWPSSNFIISKKDSLGLKFKEFLNGKN